MSRFKNWTAEAVLNKKVAKQAAQPKETANGITRNIIRIINSTPGCVAYRINNVGVWDEAKQVYRKGNTKKGIFDISATLRGRAAWFDAKAGRDKASPEQMIFQQEQRLAGAIAEFMYSTDEFLKWWEKNFVNPEKKLVKILDK